MLFSVENRGTGILSFQFAGSAGVSPAELKHNHIVA
jgi:hypothetical protein